MGCLPDVDEIKEYILDGTFYDRCDDACPPNTGIGSGGLQLKPAVKFDVQLPVGTIKGFTVSAEGVNVQWGDGQILNGCPGSNVGTPKPPNDNKRKSGNTGRPGGDCWAEWARYWNRKGQADVGNTKSALGKSHKPYFKGIELTAKATYSFEYEMSYVKTSKPADGTNCGNTATITGTAAGTTDPQTTTIQPAWINAAQDGYLHCQPIANGGYCRGRSGVYVPRGAANLCFDPNNPQKKDVWCPCGVAATIVWSYVPGGVIPKDPYSQRLSSNKPKLVPGANLNLPNNLSVLVFSSDSVDQASCAATPPGPRALSIFSAGMALANAVADTAFGLKTAAETDAVKKYNAIAAAAGSCGLAERGWSSGSISVEISSEELPGEPPEPGQ
jgi:hypothetical protein